MKKLLLAYITLQLLSCNKKADSPEPIVKTVTEIKTITVQDTVYKNRPEPKVTLGTVLDNQGNVYKTITLGGRTWMAENLRVQYYNNGDKIETKPDGRRFYDEKAPKYWFNPDINNTGFGSQNSDSILVYGRLYTWYAITDQRGVCPTGYYLPSAFEYMELIDTLGGGNIAGDKMKEAGDRYWGLLNNGDPKNKGTNSSGFSARASGFHNNQGGARPVKTYETYFWTSTMPANYNEWNDSTNAYSINLNTSSRSATIGLAVIGTTPRKANALSVRCIKYKP